MKRSSEKFDRRWQGNMDHASEDKNLFFCTLGDVGLLLTGRHGSFGFDKKRARSIAAALLRWANTNRK